MLRVISMGDEFDCDGFMDAIRERLGKVAEINLYVLKKQLRTLGITCDNMTPLDAERLIDGVVKAISSWVGAEGSRRLRMALRSELRKYAPEYFREKYGV